MTPPRALITGLLAGTRLIYLGRNSDLEREIIMEMMVNRNLLCEINEARRLLTLMH